MVIMLLIIMMRITMKSNNDDHIKYKVNDKNHNEIQFNSIQFNSNTVVMLSDKFHMRCLKENCVQ